MKTFVLVTCLLTIAAVVYGVDNQQVKKYHDNLAKCFQELGGPKEIRLDVIDCVLRKDSLIDEQGAVKRTETIAKLDGLISDPNKLAQAKKMTIKCIDDGYRGAGSVQEKTMKAMECSKPVFALLD